MFLKAFSAVSDILDNDSTRLIYLSMFCFASLMSRFFSLRRYLLYALVCHFVFARCSVDSGEGGWSKYEL